MFVMQYLKEKNNILQDRLEKESIFMIIYIRCNTTLFALNVVFGIYSPDKVYLDYLSQVILYIRTYVR